MTAYELTLQALRLVARMGEEGVDPDEIETWCGEGDAAVERRRFVVKRLEIEMAAAKTERDRFSERMARLEIEIERVKAGALAVLLERIELGEEPKVKTANVSAWLIDTVAVTGPEDVTAWPSAYRRLRTTETPDKENAKIALLAGESLLGLSLVHRRSLGWR